MPHWAGKATEKRLGALAFENTEHSYFIQVRDLMGTGKVTKRRVKEGVGEFPVDCPLEDCAVRVHYTARLAGTDQASAIRCMDRF